ncbi:MAG TPA: EAL domain-containing protein, partial [Fimbriimonas sp.]|nr:EAL domain-containing protein [Fimbriimonas sp.]
RIARDKDLTSPEYVGVSRVVRNFLIANTDFKRVATYKRTAKGAVYIYDSGVGSGRTASKSKPGFRVGAAPEELFRSFRATRALEGVSPARDKTGETIVSFAPLGKAADGSLYSLSLEMSYSEFAEDQRALVEALKTGFLATLGFSLLIGLAASTLIHVFNRKSGRLTEEMINARTKSLVTEAELIEMVRQSGRSTDAIAEILRWAGCLAWTGTAAPGKGTIEWVGDLKHESGMQWLMGELATGSKFDEIWVSRRNPEDQAEWQNLLDISYTKRIERFTSEYRIKQPDGQEVWFEEHVSLKYLPDGTAELSAFVKNIHDAKTRTDEIRRLAYYDSVTGLINRFRTHEVIGELLPIHPNLNVFAVEIANFSTINESWGAEVADCLLLEFGNDLIEAVGANGIVGRLAGNDFVVIIPNDTAMSWLVSKINSVSRMPLKVGEAQIDKDVFVGYAASEPNDTAVTLIRKANLALDMARRSSSSLPVMYKPEMSFRSKMRVELETAMRQALVDHEFYLMFQPIYCNTTGRLVKAEALVRWQSSRFGLVSPGTFVPIAEESDFINHLGAFVIDEAAKAVKEFIGQTGIEDMVISLNVSLRQLKSSSILPIFQSSLERNRLDPRNLLVEVTESSIMQDGGECVEILNKLKQKGLNLAIDDFGTGYSSLATLASLPFDCLKIDKRFVDGIGVDPKQE